LSRHVAFAKAISPGHSRAGISRCEAAATCPDECQGYCALDKGDRERGKSAGKAGVIRCNVTMDRNSTIQRGEAAGNGLGWARTGGTAGDGAADTLAIFAFALSSTAFSSG
jgi:hypothetical protein